MFRCGPHPCVNCSVFPFPRGPNGQARVFKVDTMLTRIMVTLTRFLRREDGPTSVEYAVMIMCVLGAVLTGVQLLGGGLDSSGGALCERVAMK